MPNAITLSYETDDEETSGAPEEESATPFDDTGDFFDTLIGGGARIDARDLARAAATRERAQETRIVHAKQRHRAKHRLELYSAHRRGRYVLQGARPRVGRCGIVVCRVGLLQLRRIRSRSAESSWSSTGCRNEYSDR